MDFSKFQNKYIFTGELTVENALHISLGHGVGEDDSPFIKTGDKGYYIPGSSFRGYLRTKIERIVNNDFKLINIDNNENIENLDVKLIFGYTNLKDKKDQEKIAKKLGSEYEDKIFKQMSGKIHISDLIITTEANEIKRDGIKISRDTGTTENGAKFDYNVLDKGNKFSFEMILENVEDYQLDLIKIGLQDIMNGDLFGGKTSRGIGKCKLELKKVKYVDASKKSNFEKYIFQNKMGESNNPEEIMTKNKLKLAE